MGSSKVIVPCFLEEEQDLPPGCTIVSWLLLPSLCVPPFLDQQLLKLALWNSGKVMGAARSLLAKKQEKGDPERLWYPAPHPHPGRPTRFQYGVGGCSPRTGGDIVMD